MSAAKHMQVQGYEARYWDLVRDTMVQVFGVSPDIARHRTAEFAQWSEARAPEDHELSFHDEPLSVAANLLRLPVTDEQAQHYDQLASNVDWGLPELPAIKAV
jgi:hypothetical protein